MSKGDTFENDFLKLVFNATAIGNLADNASASPLTNLYVSLHYADPGETGNQTSNEASYGSYQRVAVARTSGSTGWNVTNNSVSPGSTISFPAATSGSGTGNDVMTHFAVGTASSSTGKILYSGSISPTIAVSSGVTPQLTTASTITED